MKTAHFILSRTGQFVAPAVLLRSNVLASGRVARRLFDQGAARGKKTPRAYYDLTDMAFLETYFSCTSAGGDVFGLLRWPSAYDSPTHPRRCL
jgi:hypothetical protein